MTYVLPPPFLFRWTFPVRRDRVGTRSRDRLLDLGPEHNLCWPGEMTGNLFPGWIRLGWQPEALEIMVRVTGKTKPAQVNRQDPLASDGIQLWVDTRATQNVHRATRFCHHFCLLPAARPLRPTHAWISRHLIARSREEALSTLNTDAVTTWWETNTDGYELHASFPTESLVGYAPEQSRALGFYLLLRDAELGDHSLTVGAEFPYDFDPSLWQTLELVD